MKPHEDWVYESWTVDCVCGVNFDDGKEMVDCDECGVWVHTWCSRYVKEDDLFVCHKCKKKIKNNDIEKLSVTKSMRMGNVSGQMSETVPILKTCSEIPIEERVHVQGVPGGDLALFECVSSVFTRQLWKCSGYVPKKFRFQYKEFPCWDEIEKKDDVCEIGDDDDEDTCAGVLLSMSKENVVDGRNLGSRDIEMKHSRSGVDKEKSLLFPLSANKRRKESSGGFDDRVYKKVKVAGKEEEGEKKAVL
ncbi:hypothetical protein CARUB_v10002908mg [Capsella rubella]|uniref:Zinc finger PHD-type domain-containing protein n=1 Tax=Capsella rubella TaxID=81985 RepID=R0FJM2_9BRAS|nr:uncharacterized protein LOC17882823 [Capsella rubella]EOA22306.1 hypothetical protein CARUB_v10002908mg [Capsella rubella]